MNKLIRLFENKRNLASLLLLSGLIFTTYNIQENSGRIKRLTNFESGVQTCFSRVNQSYTAKMIGDSSSNYLSQNFQNLTEECFAEGILNVDDNFQLELMPVAKKLSMLASNVHWFHEDLSANGANNNLGGSGEGRDIGSRFEKIEVTKDEILDATESFKTEITNSLNKQKTIFYVCSVFLVILMMSEYISTSRRRLLNKLREKEAEAELYNNDGINSVKIGEIVKSALEQNDLSNCSRLFNNYHTHQVVLQNKSKSAGVDLENLITPLTALSKNKIDEKIEKMWNDDSVGVSVDEQPQVALTNDEQNLELLSSKIIDLLSDKLFSHGIKMDLKIPEQTMIKARQEELEQILYHLFSFAINSSASNSNGKSIWASANRLGNIVAFDLSYSGRGFDEDILKQRVGLQKTDKKLDVDLEIAQTLLEEGQSKIQIDNKINQQGEVSGGRIKIIFRAGENKAKLVNLKVGSKKEILASMKEISH